MTSIAPAQLPPRSPADIRREGIVQTVAREVGPIESLRIFSRVGNDDDPEAIETRRFVRSYLDGALEVRATDSDIRAAFDALEERGVTGMAAIRVQVRAGEYRVAVGTGSSVGDGIAAAAALGRRPS